MKTIEKVFTVLIVSLLSVSVIINASPKPTTYIPPHLMLWSEAGQAMM